MSLWRSGEQQQQHGDFCALRPPGTSESSPLTVRLFLIHSLKSLRFLGFANEVEKENPRVAYLWLSSTLPSALLRFAPVSSFSGHRRLLRPPIFSGISLISYLGMEQRDHIESSEQAAKRAKKSLQALIAAAFRNENECLRIVEENSDINTNEKRKKMTTTKEKRKEVRIDESDFFNLLNDIQKGKDAPNDKGMEVRVPKDKEDEARITKDKREKMRISKEKRKEVRIDESDFFNLLNDINLGEDLSNRKKKGRGPTKLLGANIIGGENPRLKVEWNERGQPVGKNSEKFVSLLGVLAKEMVPLNKPSWTKVNMGIKNTIWLLLLQKCIIEECRKKIVFRLIGKLWRNWKSMLSRKLKKAVSPSACKPLEVKEHEWNEFVQVRRSLEWKQLSTKMKKVRSKVTYPYTLSRKGYARLEHDLKSEKGNDESIPRVELWIKGRIKKDGNVVNRASMVTMKKIKESSQDPNYKSSFSIKDDLLSQVIGPEHPGCVRGLGFGATSSNINAQLQVVSWKQAMNNKVNEVMERQKVMEEIISQLTSSMNIGRNGVGNACASKDVLASHRDDNGNLEGKPCKLLHWIASGEVVAYGEISSTDPSALVDNVPLGPDCYKVWVRDVLISNIALPRPSRLHFTVDDAMASTVAWPSKYIDLF